jgi:hypothetical protein
MQDIEPFHYEQVHTTDKAYQRRSEIGIFQCLMLGSFRLTIA